MTNNIFSKFLIILSLSLFTVFAQDEQDVDAIEKARQAKEAAEKAAAEASAATEAAIEAAAQKAAKEAREEAKRKKEEEEARKLAEAKAAEEAELDAAATAAAEEAKRKMAEELGLEYESPSTEVADSDSAVLDTTEEFVAKESLGINVGLTGSVGFVNGEYIVNTPVGASLVINTPYGFKFGGDNGLNLTASLVIGSYNGRVGEDEPLNAVLFGVGANATLFQFVFSETHASQIGSGFGVRNFSGLSLERLLKRGLNMPVNVLVGVEGFLALKADDNTENSTYWGGLGVRLDYDF